MIFSLQPYYSYIHTVFANFNEKENVKWQHCGGGGLNKRGRMPIM